MSKTFTQERFDDMFDSDKFEVTIKCKKCGSTNIDMRFDPGHVYSEYTSDSACVEVWCADCKETSTRYP